MCAVYRHYLSLGFCQSRDKAVNWLLVDEGIVQVVPLNLWEVYMTVLCFGDAVTSIAVPSVVFHWVLWQVDLRAFISHRGDALSWFLWSDEVARSIAGLQLHDQPGYMFVCIFTLVVQGWGYNRFMFEGSRDLFLISSMFTRTTKPRDLSPGNQWSRTHNHVYRATGKKSLGVGLSSHWIRT